MNTTQYVIIVNIKGVKIVYCQEICLYIAVFNLKNVNFTF